MCITCCAQYEAIYIIRCTNGKMRRIIDVSYQPTVVEKIKSMQKTYILSEGHQIAIVVATEIFTFL